MQPTVYLDSVRKNIIHNGRLFRLVLWDTAGQEKFNSLVPSSIRGSQCAIVVFSVDDRNSFIKCDHWIKLLRSSSSGHDCPAILIGNKTDLARNVTKQEGFDFAMKNGMAYMELSAKTGAGMENLIAQIIESVEGKL
jgi:small GTP-binding protein